MSTLEMTIAGMTCEHCVASLRTALESLPGVASAEVTVGAAQVRYDEAACGVPCIVAQVEVSGFQVTSFRKLTSAAGRP